MKVIVTGCTGFVGSAVLRQCLSNPTITAVYAVSRKPLDPITSISLPKLKVIIHEDFTSYPPSLLSQFEDADACIWAMGVAQPKTPEDNRTINHIYPLAGAEALKSAFSNSDKSFRLVFMGGKYTERNQNAKLWFMEEGRKLRGTTENMLLDMAIPGSFEVAVVRPSMVLQPKASVGGSVATMLDNAIRVDYLARTMTELALGVIKRQGVWEAKELTRQTSEYQRESA